MHHVYRCYTDVLALFVSIKEIYVVAKLCTMVKVMNSKWIKNGTVDEYILQIRNWQ